MTRALPALALATGAALLVARAVRGAASGDWTDFVEEVRTGMTERELELRTTLGLDGRHDAVDAQL